MEAPWCSQLSGISPEADGLGKFDVSVLIVQVRSQATSSWKSKMRIGIAYAASNYFAPLGNLTRRGQGRHVVSSCH